jgi:hypothetical protein
MLKVPKQPEGIPEVCDLTQTGSDAITLLPNHFVNEEKPQITKNS